MLEFKLMLSCSASLINLILIIQASEIFDRKPDTAALISGDSKSSNFLIRNLKELAPKSKQIDEHDQHQSEVNFDEQHEDVYLEVTDSTGQRPWLASAAAASSESERPFASNEQSKRPDKNGMQHNLLEQLTNNSALNRVTLGQIQNQSDEINQDFLSLFDDLWRLKQKTVTTLIKLDYFSNQTDEMSAAKTTQSQQQDKPSSAGMDAAVLEPNRGATPVQRLILELEIKKPFVAQTKAQPFNVMTQAAARLSGWFSTGQRRLREMAKRLSAGLFSKKDGLKFQQANNDLLKQQSDTLNGQAAIMSSQASDVIKVVAKANADSNIGRVKREISNQKKLPDHYQAICVNLTTGEMNECKKVEATVVELLEHTFPSTIETIETSCKQITYLLSHCWPQQLLQIRQSLDSWNSSLLLSSNFLLPLGIRFPQSVSENKNLMRQITVLSATGISCGSGEPNSTQEIQDRVDWMWLNLCMDTKFRLDYVRHLRCLVAWKRERAQQNCSPEYQQMQGFLDHQEELFPSAENKQTSSLWLTNPPGQITSSSSSSPGAAAEAASLPALDSNGTSNNSTNAGLKLDTDQLETKEINSKMLCCMFDQFLRCVHRQASRECGRAGAQFVVNFMSRIGTDDMKYLCNGEKRQSTNSSWAFIVNQQVTLQSTKQEQQEQHQHQQQQQQQLRYVGGLRYYDKNNNQLPAARMKIPASNRKTISNNYHHERSPFIDGNYCIDSRIQNALNWVNAKYGFSTTGLKAPSFLRNKQRTSVNHDPAFFGSDTETMSNGAVSDIMALRNSTGTTSTWLLISLFLMYNIIDRLV